MYWPGTTATEAGVAGFEAELALRVERPGAEPVASPPVTASQAGRGHGTPEPAARGAYCPPCRDDPDLFFAESPEDVESAKALCRECAIRLACFSGAMQRREPWGVWGGELFLRGEVVPRKRPRGRPRKTDVAA
jgi:WhiB family transcriptional regulator, redox-sensing transcriptional regulator